MIKLLRYPHQSYHRVSPQCTLMVWLGNVGPERYAAMMESHPCPLAIRVVNTSVLLAKALPQMAHRALCACCAFVFVYSAVLVSVMK